VVSPRCGTASAVITPWNRWARSSRTSATTWASSGQSASERLCSVGLEAERRFAASDAEGRPSCRWCCCRTAAPSLSTGTPPVGPGAPAGGHRGRGRRTVPGRGGRGGQGLALAERQTVGHAVCSPIEQTSEFREQGVLFRKLSGVRSDLFHCSCSGDSMMSPASSK
jgi:hypothetical protein